MKWFIVFFLLSFVVIFAVFNFGIISKNAFIAACYGGGLNLINSFLALVLFEFSKNRNNQIFLIANIGGIGLRLGFLLIAIIILIKFLIIDIYGFILVFFIFYFILLFSEIWYFSKFKRKNNNIVK